MTKAEFLTDWPDYVFIVRYWKVSDEMVRLRFASVSYTHLTLPTIYSV